MRMCIVLSHRLLGRDSESSGGPTKAAVARRVTHWPAMAKCAGGMILSRNVISCHPALFAMRAVAAKGSASEGNVSMEWVDADRW